MRLRTDAVSGASGDGVLDTDLLLKREEPLLRGRGILLASCSVSSLLGSLDRSRQNESGGERVESVEVTGSVGVGGRSCVGV